MEIPYTPPVDPSTHGALTLGFLIVGMSLLSAFFTTVVAKKKNFLLELFLAIVASFFLGFGVLFLFLWADVYV